MHLNLGFYEDFDLQNCGKSALGMSSLFDTFMQQRSTPSGLSGETPLEDVFDSLALLDLFLLLESSGIDVDLDGIASCTTLGQLRNMIGAKS